MNFDAFLDKVYDKSKYNCAHFVCEVWQELFNEDISNGLEGFRTCPQGRKAELSRLRDWTRLEAPRSPCVALFQACRKDPHVGIFLVGKILHIRQTGVEYTSIENVMVNFNQVRFYNVKSNHC